MIKVVKFGGSSLASATQFAKVGNIIKADPERKFVSRKTLRKKQVHSMQLQEENI